MSVMGVPFHTATQGTAEGEDSSVWASWWDAMSTKGSNIDLFNRGVKGYNKYSLSTLCVVSTPDSEEGNSHEQKI